MGFITWVMIILIATGILVIQIFKYAVNSDNENINQFDKTNAEMSLETFYNHNFAGKVTMVLWLGASLWAFLFFGLKDNMKGGK
jgi:hypothetical protein